MKVYTLSYRQQVPVSIAEAWEFFSDPNNLKILTPSYMGFHVLSGAEKKMHAGQIIVYEVRPALNIPLTWVTEITHVEHQRFFVDEQRFGPYKLWHHQHHFHVSGSGIEIEDIVHYVIPFGLAGRIFSGFIRKKLASIFQYREDAIRKLYGS